MLRPWLVSVWAALTCLSASLSAQENQSEVIRLAVASNFVAPARDIAEQFEEATGHEVRLSFGSSGKLYAQIVNGAPFDLFLSADQSKPIALEQDGYAVAGSRVTYAQGRLVLWSSEFESLAMGSSDKYGIDLYGTGLNPRALLGDLEEQDKIAIANPRVAPYGVAALEALEAIEDLNISGDLSDRLVYGDNISQTYQFVDSGNAKFGLVALSQVWREHDARMPNAWVIPPSYYAPIKQDMVLLTSAQNAEGAKKLFEWILSDEMQSSIRSYGYDTENQKLPSWGER